MMQRFWEKIMRNLGENSKSWEPFTSIPIMIAIIKFNIVMIGRTWLTSFIVNPNRRVLPIERKAKMKRKESKQRIPIPDWFQSPSPWLSWRHHNTTSSHPNKQWRHHTEISVAWKARIVGKSSTGASKLRFDRSVTACWATLSAKKVERQVRLKSPR